MNSQSKGKLRPVRRFLALVFALAAWTGSRAAQRLPESTHGASVASQAPLAGKPGDYVGSETCAGCHGAEGESFAKTPHAPAAEAAAGTKAAANAPHAGGSGCETCHGPGKAHADAEGDAAGDHAKEVAAAKLIFSFHATPKENSMAERLAQAAKVRGENPVAGEMERKIVMDSAEWYVYDLEEQPILGVTPGGDTFTLRLQWMNYWSDATAARLGFPDDTLDHPLQGLYERSGGGWLVKLTPQPTDLDKPEDLERVHWAYDRFAGGGFST